MVALEERQNVEMAALDIWMGLMIVAPGLQELFKKKQIY